MCCVPENIYIRMQISCLLGEPWRKHVWPSLPNFWLQFVLARPLGQIFLEHSAIVFCISLSILCLALFVFWMESVDSTVYVVYGWFYFLPHIFVHFGLHYLVPLRLNEFLYYLETWGLLKTQRSLFGCLCLLCTRMHADACRTYGVTWEILYF